MKPADNEIVKIWVASIPAEVTEKIKGLLVVERGFAFGPGFVARQVNRCNPPVPLEPALRMLSRHVETFRAAHVRFEDGSTVYVERDGFRSYAPAGEHRGAGVTVAHPPAKDRL